MRFLRVKQLQEKLGIKRSTIYQKVSRGLLPPPRRWGNIAVWVEEEVEKVMEAVIQGKKDDEIRRIVRSFTKNRALNGESNGCGGESNNGERTVSS